MKGILRSGSVVVVITLAMMLAAVPVSAADDPTVEITGDFEITTEESTTLTGTWNGGGAVNNLSWSVDGAVVATGSFAPLDVGTDTYDFSSDEAGSFLVEFAVWHQTPSGNINRLVSTAVTVEVTEPEAVPDEPEWKNHGAYVSSVAHATESGPGKGAVVSEAAKSDIGKKIK
jgi:hypothetical protein